MKHSKLLVLLSVMLMLCLLLVACEDANQEHEYTEWSITVAPTETAPGTAVGTCICGASKEFTIPALTDALWTVETTPATHSETGLSVYTSVYGTVEVVLDVIPHEWRGWDLTAPTETSPGSATRTCACGETETVVVPVLTDTSVWSLDLVPATHAASGTKTYTSEYGTVVLTVPQIPHTFGEWSITADPTEAATGTATRTCECGESETFTLPALSDTTFWTLTSQTDATHAAAGEKVYLSEYGSVTVVLPQIPHAFGEWSITVEPTEAATGTAVRLCECGASDTADVPVLTDAIWTYAVVTPATHTATGSATYTSVYGVVTVTLSTVPHTYGEWSITADPTETATGTAVRLCECGASDTADVPVLTDAIWTYAVVMPATHTATGSATYTSVYGVVTVTLPIVPHTYGEWSIVSEPTEAATGTATRTCECGETDTFTLPVLTDADFWTVTVVPASYNAAGSKTYTSAYGTVTVTLPKLVAPYDEKTYSDVSIDAEEIANGTVRVETAWSEHTVTLDANGAGMGEKYPFRGYTVITMVDPATGLINIRVYDLKAVSSGETTDPDDPWGEYESGYESYAETQYEVDYESYTDYVGYVDFATGLIVRGNDPLFRNVFLFTPFEIGATADRVKVSVWNSQYMAVAYTYGDTTYTFFCDGTRVWFGITLTDAQGNAVAAEDAYNAPYVYVKDAEGNLIASFGYNGEGQSTLDGLEGPYTNEETALVLSGFGTLTLNGAAGVYAAAPADAAYDIDVYMLDAEGNRVAYYQVTVGEGNTFAFSAPQVTVSFSAGEYATVNPITGAQNIPMPLPTPTNELMTFKGWFYDEACTQPVAETFVPTEDVTLYASWKAKVVIHLVGTVGDDATVLYLGEGDVIGTALPVYGINTDMMKKFVGWYVDANGNGAVDEEDFLLEDETTVTAEDTNITLIAVWEDLPAYYGTYYGTEIWNAGYGNSGGKTLTIDENGNISGLKTGIVVSYDPATQQVKWKTSASATTTYTFYFDAETGVIAGIYNNNDILNDYYLFSRYISSAGKVTANFGVNAPKEPGSSTTGYYAQFVQVHTKLGENTILFLYNNHIYNNVSITTTAGTALAVTDIRNAKTVVVTDRSTGNVVIALAAVNDIFGTGSKTQPLDSYYGTYTNGDETVVLDGTGVITYGEKTGTYTLREDGSFDVYIQVEGVNTEYMVLTLDGAAFAMVKPTVTVTFVTDHDSADAIVANKNIAITLPTDLSETGYVFKGWYAEGDENQTLLDATYMPVADVTLVAKWASEAILTIVYNDGTTENLNVVYGVGDTATVADPTYRKHKFDGWFTTATFDEGTEWTSGTTVTGSLTIYALWSDAPIYNNTYVPVELTGTLTNGNTSSYYPRTSAVIAIDPYGKAPKTGYPFNGGDVEIKNYDAATGYLELYSGTTLYKGYIDAASGIIVLSKETGESATFGEVDVLAIQDYGYASDQFSSSYWNAGKTRVIEYSYTDENSESHVLRIFVHNGQVYFNVTFMDALTGGNAVEGKACYKASSLYVFDSEGTEIARFGYNGTTMVALDGYEGTYTCTDAADLVLNGVDTITFGSYTGTYTKAADGATYTFDAYVNENGTTVYYEITVDKETMTYTANKPMVEVTFDYDGHGENVTVSYNKNVAIALETPALVEGFVFRYWYVTEGEAITSYTPTADEAVVLHTKWDAGVSLTVVYGNGMETVTTNFGAGDALDMSAYKPAYTNGMAFGGWFTDEECTVAFDATTITENTTVYCKWVVKAPYVMEDKSVQGTYACADFAFAYADGVWTSGNQGANSTKSIIRITALGDITVTFRYWASSESATKWDYLYIQTGTEGSSSVSVIYTDGGSSTAENFKDGSITLTAGEYVEFVYTKDGSAAGGLDQAYIKDLAVNGTFVTDFG